MSDVLNAFFNPITWLIAITVASFAALLEWRNQVLEQAKRLFDLKMFKPAITSSTHALHTGGISNYYLNLDYLSTVPEDAAKLTSWYVEVIEQLASTKNIDGLIFIDKDAGPVGAIALMGGITSQTGLPALITRLKKRTVHARISGRPEVVEKLSHGANVVIITDVITAAETVKEAIDTVASFGAKVVAVCTLLDRRTERDDIGDASVLQWITESDLASESLIKSNL